MPGIWVSRNSSEIGLTVSCFVPVRRAPARTYRMRECACVHDVCVCACGRMDVYVRRAPARIYRMRENNMWMHACACVRDVCVCAYGWMDAVCIWACTHACKLVCACRHAQIRMHTHMATTIRLIVQRRRVVKACTYPIRRVANDGVKQSSHLPHWVCAVAAHLCVCSCACACVRGGVGGRAGACVCWCVSVCVPGHSTSTRSRGGMRPY